LTSEVENGDNRLLFSRACQFNEEPIVRQPPEASLGATIDVTAGVRAAAAQGVQLGLGQRALMISSEQILPLAHFCP
jgi:hypothetical protein